MNNEGSEKVFADYLDRYGISYKRAYPVGGGDIDFLIEARGSKVFCDVKEVREPKEDSHGKVEADVHIKSDLRKLRSKFKKGRPEFPLLLVTMNYSTRFFTGFTISKAIFGQIGVKFNRSTRSIESPLHHLPKGNATLTQNQLRSISAVFVYDRTGNQHSIFLNPFADHPVPKDLFPEVRVIKLDPKASEEELINLRKIVFWNSDWKSES